MSALESLLPDDLAKHIQLNHSRLSDLPSLRVEVAQYIEQRTDNIVKDPLIAGGSGGAGQRRRGADDMDVGSLRHRGLKGDFKGSKGKGYGGSKGGRGDSKGTSGDAARTTCWNCGKKGHKAENCWQKLRTGSKGDFK
eukprot:9155101-Pyramimonas_sp.AAC.1